MTRIAIIACDHGLGHVRRCYLLAAELLRLGWEVDLFAPSQKVHRIQAALGPVLGLATVDFCTETTPDALRSGRERTIEWQKRLPALGYYDRVICDTLPEILACRPDAILIAQFFWHDVLDRLPRQYIERCTKLLADLQPRIVGSDLFAMPAVRSQPGFFPVGLYGRFAPPLTAGDVRDAVLISPGSTDLDRTAYRQLLEELIEDDYPHIDRFDVDPAIVPNEPRRKVSASDYSPSTYAKAVAVVCRPGLGTLTDALAHHSTPICFTSDDNREMRHNGRVILEQRLGYHCRTLDAVLEIVSSLQSVESCVETLRRLDAEEFTGAIDTATLISRSSGQDGLDH